MESRLLAVLYFSGKNREINRLPLRAAILFLYLQRGAGRALGFIAVGKGGEKKREHIFLAYSETVVPPPP